MMQNINEAVNIGHEELIVNQAQSKPDCTNDESECSLSGAYPCVFGFIFVAMCPFKPASGTLKIRSDDAISEHFQ